MGFDKSTYQTEVNAVVTHQWHPGKEFIFTFPKLLPQAALDAEKTFLGLPDGERAEAARLALIGMLAEMVTKEPRGFDNFPTDEVMPQGQSPRSLSIRFRDYFDDPSQPELEAILAGAWQAYRGGSRPVAYLKSHENSGARDSQPTRATQEA